MLTKKILLLLSFFTLLCGCDAIKQKTKQPVSDDINIIYAKMVTGIDEKLMPIKVRENFPKETSEVFCWFQWTNAKVNTPIIAEWLYVTDNIPIHKHTFIIPRKNGVGSVALSMPEGRSLPSGQYQLALTQNNKTLKTIPFTVE